MAAGKRTAAGLSAPEKLETLSAKELTSRISEAFESFPPQLKRAAHYITSHPDEVAFKSMRSLAKDAGVVPGTMVRLAKAIGLQRYEQLRLAFQTQIQVQRQPLLDRARSLRVSRPASKWRDNVRELIDEELKTLQNSINRIQDRDLEKARKLFHSARKVFIVGMRGMFPAAFCLHYSVSMFSEKAVLVDGSGGSNMDPLRAMGKQDAIVIFTCRPYPRDVVRTIKFARERGTQIIAVTDGLLSPAARAAAVVFDVPATTSSLLSSAAANVLLSKVLAALLFSASGGSSVRAIENADKQFAAFDVYCAN